MTLNRFLLYRTGIRWFEGVSNSEVLTAFFMGLRFDLLVLGFVMLPVVPFSFLLRWPRSPGGVALVGLRWYLGFAWTVIVLLGVIGHLFFVLKGRQFTWWDMGFLSEQQPLIFGFLMSTSGILVSLIALCELSIGWRELGRWTSRVRRAREALEGDSVSVKVSWGETALRTLGPWLLVGLAARGTVTPHHLEKQHSDVSSSPALNQLVLNPVWSFDKKPDAP